MPNHEEHCKYTQKKYGKTYSWLHKWMDGPSRELKEGHRILRHDVYTVRHIYEKWGYEAAQVCLDHIRLDAIESNEVFKTHSMEEFL